MCDVNRNNEITQTVEDVKKSSTPTGWHICRNGLLRRRTPAGCNIAGASLDKIIQLHDLSSTQKAYCTPLGCGYHLFHLLQICHPAGVRLPLTSPSTNMSPRWGAATTYFTFYKYVTPLGCGYHFLRLLQICHPAGVRLPLPSPSTNMS